MMAVIPLPARVGATVSKMALSGVTCYEDGDGEIVLMLAEAT